MTHKTIVTLILAASLLVACGQPTRPASTATKPMIPAPTVVPTTVAMPAPVRPGAVTVTPENNKWYTEVRIISGPQGDMLLRADEFTIAQGTTYFASSGYRFHLSPNSTILQEGDRPGLKNAYLDACRRGKNVLLYIYLTEKYPVRVYTELELVSVKGEATIVPRKEQITTCP